MYNLVISLLTVISTGKCADLGWVCVPVVAESYGAWGLMARDFFSKLGSRLAM